MSSAHRQPQPTRKKLSNRSSRPPGRRLGRRAHNPTRRHHRHNARPQGRLPSPTAAGRGRRRVWNEQQPRPSYFGPPDQSQARQGLWDAPQGHAFTVGHSSWSYPKIPTLLRTSRVKVAERMGLATLRSGPNGPMPTALPVRLTAHRTGSHPIRHAQLGE